MADDTSTPDAVDSAPPAQRQFKIPVENASDTHAHAGKQFKIPVEGKQFVIPFDAPTPPPADSKYLASLPEMKAYNPGWWERVKNTWQGGRAAEAGHLAGTGGDLTERVKAIANEPFLSLRELFPANNTATPSGRATNVAKGAADAISGLSSPTQVGITAGSFLAGIGEARTVAGGLHALGTAMMPTMAMGMVDSAKRIHQARESGDQGAEDQAWGDLAANIAMVAVPHAAGKVVEGRSYSELNTHAQDLYGEDFRKLDDSQKTHVLYQSAEDASPAFRKRVDQEVARINSQKVPGEGGRTVAEVRNTEVNDTLRQQNERAVKLQAQKRAFAQLVRQQTADEHYRQTQAEAEAKVRSQTRAVSDAQDVVRARLQREREDAATSPEQQRGFAVNDQRSNTRGERGYITGTEREKEPVHAPGTAPEETTGTQVTDRRAVQEEPVSPQRASELERPVQEYAEQNHGSSFSQLPLDQQRAVASHFERTSPEVWDAFKGTQAYDAFRRHADAAATMAPVMDRWLADHSEGTGEALQPGADVYAGVAHLLMARTDVPATLKSNPETYQAVNQYAEQHFGKSFDTLEDSDKPAALAGYLRENPAKGDLFMSPEVSERLRTGQHIDLANMEANLRDKQQVAELMQYRDQTRQQMDEQFAGDIVRQEHADIRASMDRLVREAPAGETQRTDSIAAQAAGLTQLAERINLDGVADHKGLFSVERAIRQVPEGDRTDEMRQFAARIRQLHFNIRTELVRRYREGLISEMRILSPEPSNAHTAPPLTQELYRAEGEHPTVTKARRLSDEAIAMVARDIVSLEGQRAAAQVLADNRSGEFATPEQKAAGQEFQETADFIRQKEEAAVSAARQIENPSKPIEPGKRIPLVMGRATYVELNSGERIPAHYAVAEGGTLVTSHNPLNNFKPVERYPQEAQPRDYQGEPELQVGVHERANKPNADIFHSDTIRATDGPPIVMPDGVVLSGNGREQGAKLAVSEGNFAPVHADLFEKAARFGVNPEEFKEHSDPRLVRVLDNPVTDPQELRRLGVEMNWDAGRGMSEAERQRALSGLLTPAVVDRLANVFQSIAGDVSLRTAMRMRSADLAQILTDAGLVDPTKRAAYFSEDGELTEPAKALIEDALAGRTVSNGAVLKSASDSTKDKLGRVSMDFILMQAAGELWNLASYNTDAVRLYTRAEDQAAYLRNLEGAGQHGDAESGTYSAVERMLHPERFRLSNLEMAFDGQPTHPPVHPVVEALAMALERKPKEYQAILGNYADAATQGGTTMFGTAEPWDAFNQHIGEKLGVAPVIFEEWGMVNGLPEAAKQQIETAREGLLVEPDIHNDRIEDDVQPDTTSVDDALKSETPTSVAQLRDALAKHPNLSDEQAQAIADIFEQVLPRATGQTLGEILGNRRLSLALGGREGGARGYTDLIDNANSTIRLLEGADTSTVMHEMFHFLRPMLKPEHQATLNEFVGAKPGAEWTTEQEEKAAQAFERYHVDGGRRRGKIEKAFAVIHKAMQAVYDAASALGLVKPSPKVAEMFDNWYDWERSERKPITARVDVAKLAEKVKDNKVEVPGGAKVLEETAYLEKGAQNFVFTSREQASDFIDKNSQTIRTYQMLDGKDGNFYVKASFQPGSKRLFQGNVSSIGDLARQAKEIEERLKKTFDPREEARLRAQLNSIENKMGTGAMILGDRPEAPKDEVTQLIYGMGEMPSVHEPTTPAQAMGSVQVHGDPTEVEVRANGNRDRGALHDEASGVPESGGTEEIHGSAGESDGADETAGRELPGRAKAGGGGRKAISAPAVDPLAKVKAADLAKPKRERGTPVADPEAWKEYSEALGIPKGTPPPTVRLPEDLRNLMIFPGQSEAIEVALSALQQHDAVVMAAPTGAGKTFMNLSIADQLLGNDSSKVGLIITRSRNLIHGPDGYVDVGQRLGVQVDHLPGDINDVQGGGVYAGTYAGIRGDQNVLSIPWDFVIFDESAEGRNWNESAQGQAVTMLGHAAKKVVYASATPFHTAIEVGYMHKLGLWPEGGFFEWARQFGVVENGPNSYTGGYAPKKLMKLRQQLIERGQWVTLHRDMDGVSAHVAMVPQDAETRTGVKAIRNAFAMAGKVFRQQGRAALARAAMAHETIYLKRFIESRRIPHVLETAKKAIAEGWQPVIYSEYRSGTDNGMDFFKRLPPGVGDMVNKMLPALPDVVKAVREQLGEKAAIFAGEANALREDERTAYMTGKKNAVYATYAAGGVGVSFHDRVGDRPRMGMFLGLPWSGIMFEQSLGRTWRYGTKSNVANVFFTSDALPEMKVLATKILPRMRALNAAVYGEDMETQLSKQLRDSTGIPEEAISYEMGNEYQPDAAQWEQQGDGAGHSSFEDLKLPKAEDAKNKGMKYKAQPKRLYQGPVNPLHDDANEEFEGIPLASLPPSMRRAIEANRTNIKAAAVDAAKLAVPGVESPRRAIERTTKDNVINAKMMYAMYDAKKEARAAGNVIKTAIRLLNTAGDRAVWKYFEDAGMGKEGKEIQRKLIERSHLITEIRGEYMAKISDITENLKPGEHAKVVDVVEGNGTSDDPRINKAAAEYRQLFTDIRKRLGDAGAKFKSYDDGGKPIEIPWKDFRDNPNYWPHIWDWDKKITVTGKDGKPAVKTMGELHDMEPGEEKDRMVQEWAGKNGIDPLKAYTFFAKNRRGVRLAPNLEKARESELPGYGKDHRTMNIYINQVAEMLANIATVGQEREKINPDLSRLPRDILRTVDSIITADLNPISIGTDNSRVLRRLSQWVVISKMGLSVLKVPTHVMLKTPLATNMRSLVGGMLEFARNPAEVTRTAREAGILTDYVRQAMMMEYGLHDDSGLDRKMLQVTGFTSTVWLSRVIAGATGRHFLMVHAEPALRANPTDAVLRRKLSDLYGFSNEDLDRIAKGGVNEHDVKRSMIAAADWTTGSGRPSELPPMLRAAGSDHPIDNHFRFALRVAYLLKTYTFKTASLVNRTVFDEMGQKNFKPLLRLLIAGGAAGLALNAVQMGVNSVANPEAADEQKRRFKAIADHPQGVLWLEGSNLSYALGLYPAKVMFDRIGTYDEGDVKKFTTNRRLANATSMEVGGILGSDAENGIQGALDYMQTFGDDGVNHRNTPEERRAKIVGRLADEEFAPWKAVKGVYHVATGGDKPAASDYVPHRRSHRKSHAVAQ
jgi:ddrB-like ParB superfamily domain